MSYIFFALGALHVYWGLQILYVAKSAIHEIEGTLALLIATVFISAGGIITAINGLKKKESIINLTDIMEK